MDKSKMDQEVKPMDSETELVNPVAEPEDQEVKPMDQDTKVMS